MQAFLEETLEKIQSGVQYQTLPDFTFFSDDPEQNRIVANEQLYDLAIGTPLRGNLQSPIKIDFSPSNKNLIEFTAKPNLEDVRTPERPKRTPVLAGKPKQSPAANPVKVAAAISPGFANKPSCLFINKVDTAERNGFIEDEDEEIVSRKLLGDDPEDIIDADQIRVWFIIIYQENEKKMSGNNFFISENLTLKIYF